MSHRRFQKERRRLRRAPAIPFDTDEVPPVLVTPHARLHFEGNRYSVPPALVRKRVMLRTNSNEVRILDQGVEVARHARCYGKRRLLVQEEHRLAALKLRRRRQAEQCAEEFDALGTEARQFRLKLLSMPVKPAVHLRRLLGPVRLYGRKEVLAAIRQALQYQTYHAAYVEAILLQERRRCELSCATPFATKTPRVDRRHSPGRARPQPLRPALRRSRPQGTFGHPGPRMTSPRHEKLLANLAELTLRRIAEVYQEVLDETARNASSMLDVLATLTREEITVRRQRALERQMRRARLPNPRPWANTTSPSPNASPNRQSCGYSTATSSPNKGVPCSSGPRERESRIF